MKRAMPLKMDISEDDSVIDVVDKIMVRKAELTFFGIMQVLGFQGLLKKLKSRRLDINLRLIFLLRESLNW